MLTLKSIAAISPNATDWDRGKGSVAGFGARRQKSDSVAYVLKYRTAEGRQRWHTIGKHGAPWTPDLARDEARRILGEVVKGADPAGAKQEERNAETIADLCETYLDAALKGRLLTRRGRAKKPSTLVNDRGAIERHIKPLLGHLKVTAVTQQDVEQFRDDVAEGKTAAQIKTGKHGLARVKGGRGAATRVMGLLGAVFVYAVKRRLRSDNPVHGVERHAYKQRERRASEVEYAALGAALTMPCTIWPLALAGAKFLALTGWRRGEMLALRWGEIDLASRTAHLGDTKTGKSMRPLSQVACDVLRTLPRVGNDLVFPASKGNDKPMAGFNKMWQRIAALGELPADVTPHILRHSFASVAADLGFSEMTIAALLGHRKASVTSKYAHHADAVLLAAADAVAGRIDGLMRGVSL